MEKELLTVFDGFLNDQEDIRIGVIVSLAEIFLVLSPSCREDHLHVIEDILGTASEKNWRFREVLAHQVTKLGDATSTQSTWKVLIPVAK